jgi:hypothetical protein
LKFALSLSLILTLACLAGCEKHNEHDNTRPPEAFSSEPVQNHRFDGGETNPYLRPGEGGEGGGEGGEKKPAAHE